MLANLATGADSTVSTSILFKGVNSYKTHYLTSLSHVVPPGRGHRVDRDCRHGLCGGYVLYYRGTTES